MTITSVRVEEKTAGKPPGEKYSLQLPNNRIRVRDLIRIYVADQVERFNKIPGDKAARHQAPEELILNPSRPTKNTRQRDCDAEYDRAISAFCSNGFFLLIDGEQVGDLDEEVIVTGDTTVSFLRLTPLVGG